MPRLITAISSTQQVDPMVYAWVALDSSSMTTNGVRVVGLSSTNSATNNKFTVDATNDTLTPLIPGRYMVWFNWAASVTGSSGYSVIAYITKNGNNQRSITGIRNYAGSSTTDSPLDMVPVQMNGTSDYFQVKGYQNTGNTATVNAGALFCLRVGE